MLILVKRRYQLYNMSKYNILKLLDDRGLRYTHSGSKDVKIKCFSGMHEDANPSLLINTDTGEYHCFVCRAKGNIVGHFLENKEISYAESLSYQATSYAIKEEKEESEIFHELKKRLNRSKGEIVFPIVEEPKLKKISYNYYLDKRGFTKEDIDTWNIQVISDAESPYNGWIYIPIYFNNVLRTYFMRSTTTKNKIYGYKYNEVSGKNEGYIRRDILFGYDNIQDVSQPIYLFEGIFDKIWFDRTNKQSLALLGNVISPEQLQTMKKLKSVVLALDNDYASFNIVKSALPLLNANVNVSVWRPPAQKKDANECTIRQLIEQTYKEIPLKKFIQSEEYELWSLSYAVNKSKFRNA